MSGVGRGAVTQLKSGTRTRRSGGGWGRLTRRSKLPAPTTALHVPCAVPKLAPTLFTQPLHLLLLLLPPPLTTFSLPPSTSPNNPSTKPPPPHTPATWQLLVGRSLTLLTFHLLLLPSTCFCFVTLSTLLLTLLLLLLLLSISMKKYLTKRLVVLLFHLAVPLHVTVSQVVAAVW